MGLVVTVKGLTRGNATIIILSRSQEKAMQEYLAQAPANKLFAESDKVKNLANRETINSLIDSGRINANDTVFLEKAAPVEEWETIFKGSIGTLLASGSYNHRVVAWFAKRGIAA